MLNYNMKRNSLEFELMRKSALYFMTVLPNASFEIAQQEMLTDFAQGGLILIFSKSLELN